MSHANRSSIKEKKSKISILLTIVVSSSLLFLIGYNAHAVTVPDPPTGLIAIPISPTVVSLSWSPPQHNGSSPIIHYEIESKTATTSYSTLITLGNVTKYNNTGLTTGTTYIYRVSAINSIGTSIPSSEQVATPIKTSTPPKNIPPSPPTGLTATSYSGIQINLSWNLPTSNGGPPVIGYKIQYSIDSGNFANLVSNTGTAGTGYSHTGLSSAHIYSYKVFAINSVGTSNSSNTASAVPTQISSAPYPPTGLTANSASSTSISLSWTAPQNTGGSVIMGYKIEYKVGSGSYSILVPNTSLATYLHTGLITGTTYTYRVSAINPIGTGVPSNEVSAVPSKTYTPTGVTAVAVSPTEIYLSWIPPSETFGQLISGYRIDQKLSSNVFNTIVDNTGKTTNYSINNLSTGKTYTFAVVTLFTGGTESNPSPEASATPTSTSVPPSTSTPPPTPIPQSSALPNTPTGLNVTKISPSSVQISWTATSNNGKPSLTGYTIEYKIGSGAWSVLIVNTGISTSYVHTGLIAGTFTYRVSAINSAGIGNPSTEASITFATNNPSPTPPVIESSGGMLAVINTDYSISYNIIDGKILGISTDQNTFSLQIKIESKGDGVLSLNLPRELIDAKKANGNDDDYLVTSSKQILKFNETKTNNARTLAISYPAGTNEISIYGTHVVPEFPISILVLVIALIPTIFFSRKIIR
ncbi:MAG TPA: fibronectin type III domain-containing protein [Nitrosopumilaceae archaeon]|nr:fibronectin type III domain-containing protein [Nitrosopumilaceae archaeon]